MQSTFKDVFITVFGCVGSSSLCLVFLWLWQTQAPFHCHMQTYAAASDVGSQALGV